MTEHKSEERRREEESREKKEGREERNERREDEEKKRGVESGRSTCPSLRASLSLNGPSHGWRLTLALLDMNTK